MTLNIPVFAQNFFHLQLRGHREHEDHRAVVVAAVLHRHIDGHRVLFVLLLQERVNTRGLRDDQVSLRHHVVVRLLTYRIPHIRHLELAVSGSQTLRQRQSRGVDGRRGCINNGVCECPGKDGIHTILVSISVSSRVLARIMGGHGITTHQHS